MDQQRPEITWTLPIDQANLILNLLGNYSFNKIADILVNLRRQGEAQIQLLNQQAQAPQRPPVAGQEVKT